MITYFQFRNALFIVLLKYSPPVLAQWLSVFLQKRMPNCQNVPAPVSEAYLTEGNAYWCKAPSYCLKLVYLSQRSHPYRPSTHLNTNTLQTYPRTSVPPTVQFPPHYASWYRGTDSCNYDSHPRKACPRQAVQMLLHYLSLMHHSAFQAL